MEFVNHVTVLAGLAVLLVQQILKFNAIPVSFANKYPVPTLIVLSTVASVVAVWRDQVAVHGWTMWVQLVATVAVVAALTYNMTIKNWSQLRAMEGEGKV